MNLLIFGSTGDLVKRKVMPALQELKLKDLKIFALGRKDFTDEIYKDFICEGKCSTSFRKQISYKKINFEVKLREQILDILDKDNENFVYLSLPPELIELVLLGLSELNSEFKLRILIEKPFGTNLDNALKLEKIIKAHFNLKQIYLSDHYLFKEPIIELVKDKNKIEDLEIVSLEELGLENRGYYDSTGALRDMVQSHFMNILFKLIKSSELQDFSINTFKRAQYGYSQDKKSYVSELGRQSNTETFVDLELKVDKKRIRMVTGKAFKEKTAFIEINGKKIDMKDKINPYIKLLNDFFSGKPGEFPTIKDSVLAWKIINKIEENKPELEYYPRECDPNFFKV